MYNIIERFEGDTNMKKFKAGTDLTLAEYNYLEDNVLNSSDPYDSYLEYLKEKHGPCKNNYFATKACISSLQSFNGMHRHHDREDTVASLSSSEVAKANPWEWQEARNLTYCRPAEHALIHILNAEQNDLGIFGAMKILNTHTNMDAKIKDLLVERINDCAVARLWNQAVVYDAVNLLNTYNRCYMHICTGGCKSTSALEVAKSVNRRFYVLSPFKKINETWKARNAGTNPRFIDAMSYTAFAKTYNTLNLNNVLIVADEAHHLLDKKNTTWGPALLAAIENEPSLMLLGLSASKFRAKNRRKADGTMEEVWNLIFQGHVAQGIEDIAEGIEKGVLAPIKYICACYNKEAINDTLTLSRCGSNSAQKAILRNKLDILANEMNIVNILNKYQPEHMIRDLVFIEHIGSKGVVNIKTGLVEQVNDFENAKAAIMKARPELTDDNFRIVHSKQSYNVNEDAFKWFETEADDARYLVSVGMVKEGYHPDILTGGIIFRRIGAATVFEQILGRFAVLKEKSKYNITVFDFVDAIRSSKYKFEANSGSSNRGIRPDVIQKLSQLNIEGCSVIDYNAQLDDITRALNQDLIAPVFTAEELA